MVFQPFLNDLAEVLEVEPADLHDNFKLAQGNWNSLALVSTIELIDDNFDVVVDGQTLRKCETIGSLKSIISAKLEA